jgi:hypothetical protein
MDQRKVAVTWDLTWGPWSVEVAASQTERSLVYALDLRMLRRRYQSRQH